MDVINPRDCHNHEDDDMLRVSLLSMMLLPGVAMADAKFVSPGDQIAGTGSTTQTESVSIIGGRELSGESDETGSSESDEIVDYDSGEQTVEDGEEIGTVIGVASDDEEDVIIAGLEDDDGQVENIEGGECNPGTTWDAASATCWNDEPEG
ncbi:hypothetical protein MWU52_02005 [Jannaschia sp. S6380]|uniref:hypothetical protein n=1 Tax=Jannaschia sp. S6380 TaxID=2926408 RepID=UPI001FF399AA|nr:hypothetical protein [Jannaschia sp. S6380]MCK0166316.1 hypothetical protein [Jannaschia sp. S6380]